MRSYRVVAKKDSFLSIIISGFINRHRIAFAFFFAAGLLFSASLFGQYAKNNDSSLRHKSGVSKNFADYKSNNKQAYAQKLEPTAQMFTLSSVLSPPQPIPMATPTSITGIVVGTITYNGNPLPGVLVSPSSGAPAITDSNGRYVLNDLFGGAYTVVPTKSGFNFSPEAALVGVQVNRTTTQDFTASDCISNQVVTNTNDSGLGSLRNALSVVCNGSSVTFSNSTANGATNFHDGGSHTITLTTGELNIRKNINIVGPGAALLTISGNKASRVLRTYSTITISGLTVSDGLHKSSEHGSSDEGGGIYNAADLTLVNVSVLNNKIDVLTSYVRGGGIYSSGSLTLINSTVSGNDAASFAAAQLQGGGIYNAGTLKITGSTISGNHCPGVAPSVAGGGIYNIGTATITNSTISGNSVRQVGLSHGGGIYNGGTMTLTNSTITDNSSLFGGGIGNSGSSLNIGNTVVAGNYARRWGADINGGVNSRGHNMIGSLDHTAITLAPGDLTGVNIGLGPLADNGGPTKTHALLSNSPLINAGNTALAVDADNNPLLTDQRGGLYLRIDNNSPDIGAYEYTAADIALSEFGGGPNIPNGGGVNFGQTNVLTPVTKTFNITNTGSTPLIVANLRLPAGFTLVTPLPPNAFPMFPNTSAPFTVRMDADAQGVPSGTLTFDTNVTGKTPFTVNFYGAVGAAPTTAVSSITRVSNHQLCSPDIVTWAVTFTDPIPNLTPANFALVDDTGNLDGEAVSIVYGSGTSWNVGAVTGSGTGTLALKMVNPGNTNAVVTNLPFTGPTSNVNVGAATPYIFPTPATVLPNSTGNQASAPEGFANYNWTIFNGVITGGNTTPTITYTAGNNGDVQLGLVVTNSGGCVGLKLITVPIQSTLNPVVMNTNDSGAGSLRQAIVDASPGSTITFSNTTDGGATDFYDGTQHTITLTSGELILDKNLTILGPGANLLSISGNNQSRVMKTGNISGTGDVALSGLTITGGKVTEIAAAGGGIAALNKLSIDSCIIANNTAINEFGATGGGIIGSDLTITNSTIFGNTADGNTAPAKGGGIYCTHSLNLTNSTVSGNTATGGGASGSSGGGLYLTNALADVPNNIINSTIAGNTLNAGNADAFGGGIYINSTTYFRNSIVAQNTAIGTQTLHHDISGDINSMGNNLIGNTSGTFVLGDTTGNILNQNARLAPLGYYGGVFPTHALLYNSPAINAGNNCVTDQTCSSYNPSTVLTSDQRGVSRVGNVDMGAFELNNTANGGNYRFTLPGATQNSSYSYTLAPNAGSFTYTQTGGTLPNGLSVTTESGVVKLSGTPTQTGLFNFTITASDGSNTNQTDYSLGVLPPPTYQINGQVKLGASGFSNVTMTLSGSSSASVQTDLSGNYSFPNLTTGNYTVTPSFVNYTFNPPGATFNNLSANQTQDFTANSLPNPLVVRNESELRAALNPNTGAPDGHTISLDCSLLPNNTLTLTNDLSVVQRSVNINGNGCTLSGDDKYRGFFIYSGTVSISNMMITRAVAQGGAGAGGGGGAGLGGALFVNADASVTISGVSFNSNAAKGGAGYIFGSNGGSGGGGLGGDGGRGGGGVGTQADGGIALGSAPGAGIVIGAAGGGGADVGQSGGADGGGGAAGTTFNNGGGGGGVSGGTGSGVNGGAGGFGGGGAGSGGAGGFGGGGGSGDTFNSGFGGVGGFGGGGGGGTQGNVGLGGFGGGLGGANADGYTEISACTQRCSPPNPGGSVVAIANVGGGGLGAGGAVFVRDGGTLNISGNLTETDSTVTGGRSYNPPGGGVPPNPCDCLGSAYRKFGSLGFNGSAFGSGLFLQGNGTLSFSPGQGELQSISNVIADQTGSGGTGMNVGSWGLSKNGVGTLTLNGANTYTGGTMLNAGTLAFGASTSAGTGAITFAAGSTATLQINASSVPTNTIKGFAIGNTIDLAGAGLATNTVLGANNVLTITGGTVSPITLNLDPAQNFSGFTFKLTTNDNGGTALTLVAATYTISGQVTAGGNPLSGVTMMLSGSSSAQTLTDNSGNYSFANLAAGGNYTVTPSLANYNFTPSSATFNNLSAGQTQNFTANAACVTNPVVTNINDSGAGSLRQAVLDVCTGDTITFASPLFDTAQTVQINGQITINKSLTITGRGANLTTLQNVASASSTSRVLLITSGTVNLSGLNITGGNLSAGAIGGCPAAESCGGGIHNSGTLILTNSIVSNNSAGGAVISHGGGIANNFGTVNLTNSIVSGNSVAGNNVNEGGGIYNSGGILTLTNSVISGNSKNGSSDGFGGGILNESGGILTLIGSTVSSNSANGGINWGGGIYNNSSTLNLTNSTVSGNSVNGIAARGSGIYNDGSGTVNLTNSTISSNSAGGSGNQGGGIYNVNILNIRNSIISGNTASFNPNIFGSLALNDSNIIGNEANVRLAPLGNYGGSTQTHALLSGSSAINAGNNCVTTLNACATFNTSLALTTDQRGRGRVEQVDIGAYEFHAIKTPLDFDGDSKSDFAVIQGVFPRASFKEERVKEIKLEGDLLADDNQRLWTDGYGKLLHLRAGRGFIELPADVQQAELRWKQEEQTQANKETLSTEGGAPVALNWLIRRSSDGSTLNYSLGTNTDVFVPADYDGDGKTDAAVWNPISGFTVIRSSSLTTANYALGVGNSNADPTVAGDYDGDGLDDPAIYDPTTGLWTWLGGSSHATVGSITWMAGGIPAPGDYNGDGKTDFAVQLPPGASPDTAKFRIAFNDGSVGPASDIAISYGLAIYAIVPGDYDGDGKTDIAQANLSGSTINWRVLTSSSNYTLQIKRTFGVIATDRTVQGDYDGDGKVDMAIYRRASSPADGVFIVFQSSTNTQSAPFDWGDADDYPVGFFNSH